MPPQKWRYDHHLAYISYSQTSLELISHQCHPYFGGLYHSSFIIIVGMLVELCGKSYFFFVANENLCSSLPLSMDTFPVSSTFCWEVWYLNYGFWMLVCNLRHPPSTCSHISCSSWGLLLSLCAKFDHLLHWLLNWQCLCIFCLTDNYEKRSFLIFCLTDN